MPRIFPEFIMPKGTGLLLFASRSRGKQDPIPGHLKYFFQANAQRISFWMVHRKDKTLSSPGFRIFLYPYWDFHTVIFFFFLISWGISIQNLWFYLTTCLTISVTGWIIFAVFVDRGYCLIMKNRVLSCFVIRSDSGKGLGQRRCKIFTGY